MFGRKNRDRGAPVVEEPVFEAPAVCTPGECLEADPALLELPRSQEIKLEIFGESVDAWSMELAESRKRLKALIEHLDAEALGLRRKYDAKKNDGIRWFLATGTFDGDQADAVAHVRHETIKVIHEKASFATGGRAVNDVLISGDRDALGLLSQHARDELYDSQLIGDSVFPKMAIGAYENPYYRLFLAELRARSDLAICAVEAPEAMAQIFSSDHLLELPESMRDFVIIDAYAGKDSVLKHVVDDGETDDEGELFDYLRANNHSPAAKEMIRAIGLGIKAAEGCICPLNDAGLCKSSAEGLPLDALPVAIKTDMSRKKQEAGKLRDAQLAQLKNIHPISNNWSFSAHLPPRLQTIAGASSAKRGKANRSGGITMAALRRNAAEQETSDEMEMPSSLTVTVKGIDDVYSAESKDQDGVAEIRAQIVASKLFQDYIKRHPGQGLEEVLDAAVQHIMTTVNYRDDKALIRMARAKDVKSPVDGSKFPVWRFSGQDFATGIGKLGNDTRIYFGISNRGDTRRIEFTKVAHKDDVAKASKRGNFEPGQS